MRNFTITRLPDKNATFLHNNVRVHYVGTCTETGISFYCAITQNYGVKVYPNGQAVQVNATDLGSPNISNKKNAARKQRYLQFKHAFGRHKHIYVSHAVWMAMGRTIQEGKTIDHINGCKTDNHIENLREASQSDNKLNQLLPWKPNKDSALPGISPHKWVYRTNLHGKVVWMADPFRLFYHTTLLGKIYQR
jgi:hypothetical protein